MIKETKSLVRLLRAKLHKALTHQWFLNQYVKKHHLESLIICNKTLEYDKSKRIISFKDYIDTYPLRDHPRRRRKYKSHKQRYNIENASFILLKDISKTGGGWLGTIVMCSSCIKSLHSVWSLPRINFSNLQSTIDSIQRKSLLSCTCGRENRKLLTACKPIYTTTTQNNQKSSFGLVSNSFLIPDLLYDINKLVYAKAKKFDQLVLRDVTQGQVLGLDLSSTLFGSLLELMVFWLRTGRTSAQKIFQHYLPNFNKEIVR